MGTINWIKKERKPRQTYRCRVVAKMTRQQVDAAFGTGASDAWSADVMYDDRIGVAVMEISYTARGADMWDVRKRLESVGATEHDYTIEKISVTRNEDYDR